MVHFALIQLTKKHTEIFGTFLEIILNIPFVEPAPSIIVFCAVLSPLTVISFSSIKTCEVTKKVPLQRITVSPSTAAATALAIEDPPMYPGDAHEAPVPTEPLGAT